MKNMPIVVSASRMTDMPAFYPMDIIREIELRKSRGFIIHTIVLWTKHLRSITKEPLKAYLEEQQKLGTQIFIQLTITGMGKNIHISGNDNKLIYIEPGVPSMEDSLSYVEEISKFTGNPQRIRLRIDPLVKLKDSEGNFYDNYSNLPHIITQLQPMGITHYTFSFLEKDIYSKIDNRFRREGIEIIPPSSEERQSIFKAFEIIAKDKGIKISACSVRELPVSACVDGVQLQTLHDKHWPVDLSTPHSRTLCGCTKSIDIGGWPPKICPSGCLYCYARPKLK
jgi:hypothetical protein